MLSWPVMQSCWQGAVERDDSYSGIRGKVPATGKAREEDKLLDVGVWLWCGRSHQRFSKSFAPEYKARRGCGAMQSCVLDALACVPEHHGPFHLQLWQGALHPLPSQQGSSSLPGCSVPCGQTLNVSISLLLKGMHREMKQLPPGCRAKARPQISQVPQLMTVLQRAALPLCLTLAGSPSSTAHPKSGSNMATGVLGELGVADSTRLPYCPQQETQLCDRF